MLYQKKTHYCGVLLKERASTNLSAYGADAELPWQHKHSAVAIPSLSSIVLKTVGMLKTSQSAYELPFSLRTMLSFFVRLEVSSRLLSW